MARQIKFDKEEILNIAFEMVREEDVQMVTARKLAAKANCSTQPIFRSFKGMSEVLDEVFLRAMNFYSQYYHSYQGESHIPFVDLGMAYINFAKTEKNIFKLLFLSEYRGTKSMYELLNGSNNAVGLEISKAKKLGCIDPSTVFMKMWIFIHGAACMVITGDFDLSEKETMELLEDQYHSCI